MQLNELEKGPSQLGLCVYSQWHVLSGGERSPSKPHMQQAPEHTSPSPDSLVGLHSHSDCICFILLASCLWPVVAVSDTRQRPTGSEPHKSRAASLWEHRPSGAASRGRCQPGARRNSFPNYNCASQLCSGWLVKMWSTGVQGKALITARFRQGN